MYISAVLPDHSYTTLKYIVQQSPYGYRCFPPLCWILHEESRDMMYVCGLPFVSLVYAHAEHSCMPRLVPFPEGLCFVS